MRVVDMVRELVARCSSVVHAVRVAAVMALVEGIIQGGRLSPATIGRLLPGGALPKHGIKRVDRLLGNPKMVGDRHFFFLAIAHRLLRGCARPVILVEPGGDFEPAVLVAQGARGFLSSDADGPMVRKCVNTVHGGEYWLARDQVGPLLEHLRTDARPGSSRNLDLLTPREHDIVRAILRGASNGAIASDFALSPQTVRNHLSSIYLKLGVSTRLELALLVMHLQQSTR